MTFSIRTSERRSLKRCPQKWYWSTVDQLAPHRSANALWFGSAVHEALAQWYLPGTERGVHPAEFFVDYIAGEDRRMSFTNEDDEREFVSAVELGTSMLDNYIKTYGRDENWFVVATEETFQAWFKRPATGLRWFRYVGTWDGVYRDLETDEIKLMEHKTAAALGVSHLPLDDQGGSYWALATPMLRRKGMIGPKENLAGITYNFLKKQKLDERPKNAEGLATNKPTKSHYVEALQNWELESGAEPQKWDKLKVDELAAMAGRLDLAVVGEVSANQPGAYFERHDLYRTVHQREVMFQRIRDEALYIEGMREGNPLYPVVKNPTKDCHWDCEFFRMCQLHESGEDWGSYRDTEYKVRDPYEAHEGKSA